MRANPGPAVGTISVVIETVNEATGPKTDLDQVLAGLARQTWPRDRLEVIVAVARGNRLLGDRLRERHPHVRIVEAEPPTYYTMKAEGIGAASGDVIALLDSDTVPVPGWAESIARCIAEGADVVAGKTRYPADAPFAKTFDFFNFGYIQGDADRPATSFLPNNAAFRREVILDHGFDPGIRRSGAAHLLGHRLVALGYRLVYEPGMRVLHNSYGVAEELRMRVKSGFDCVNLSRFDEDQVLVESRYIQRSSLGLLVVFGRRVLFDVRTAIGNRRDLEISLLHVPWFLLMSPLIRGLELVSGLITLWKPDYFPDKYGW